MRGLLNRSTTAFEMANLKRELLQCHPPLMMTEELRRIDNLPSPPPFLPETPPAHLFPWFARDTPSPRSSPATPTPKRMRGPDPWNGPREVGGITPVGRAATQASGGTAARETAAATAAGPAPAGREAGGVPGL